MICVDKLYDIASWFYKTSVNYFNVIVDGISSVVELNQCPIPPEYKTVTF